MKKIKRIALWLFIVLGVLSIFYSLAMQYILKHKKFGFVITRLVFIPHISALGFLLGIGLIALAFVIEGERK